MPESIWLQCVIGGLSAVGLVSLFWLAAGLLMNLSSDKKVRIHTLIIPESNADTSHLIRSARWRASLGCCCDDIILLAYSEKDKRRLATETSNARVMVCRPEELTDLVRKE